MFYRCLHDPHSWALGPEGGAEVVSGGDEQEGHGCHGVVSVVSDRRVRDLVPHRHSTWHYCRNRPLESISAGSEFNIFEQLLLNEILKEKNQLI